MFSPAYLICSLQILSSIEVFPFFSVFLFTNLKRKHSNRREGRSRF
ncbi:unnamed protein product [Tenebrio molitor]|nr:unnamed protein product [Tenebrio molitor]